MKAADILEVAPDMLYNNAPKKFVDISPILKARNYPLGRLTPAAVLPYWVGSALCGLPLIIGEWQFYVNTKRLMAKHLVVEKAWTFEDMLATLAEAHGGYRERNAVFAGTGWGNYGLWGAFVLGLGGTLSAGGRVHLSGAVDAATRLVDIARRYRWSPDAGSNPQNNGWWTFYQYGFSGQVENALFAFLQPMTVYPGWFTQGTMALVPTEFPRMPMGSVVPAYGGSGLAVSPYSRSADAAVDFMLWLYEDAQQRILAEEGWPPVIAGAAGTAIWSKVNGQLPAYWVKFSQNGYVDIASELSNGTGANVNQIQAYVAAACTDMYAGASVEGELGRLEKRLNALVT